MFSQRSYVMLVLFSALWLVIPSLWAGALLSREEALALAFPGADRVAKEHVFLSKDKVAAAQKISGTAIESRLWTFFAGYKEGKLLGYAVLDTTTVRTLPETVMVVLSPEGKVMAVHMLAFYEPSEYMPSKRWLEQFEGTSLDSDLRVGSGIQAITGATLSARSTSASLRRVLAIFKVGLEKR